MTTLYPELMLKIAYGPEQHTGLMDLGAKNMGAKGESKKLLRKGALKADVGIRHPHLPHTDPVHSFPGSQTKKQVGLNVAKTQSIATSDVAKALGDRSLKGRVLKGVRYSRGMADLGHGGHQLADISAHYDKPVEKGIATRARKLIPEGLGYGGGIPAGREHQKSGLKPTKSGVAADLDNLRPHESRADRQAVARQAGYGRASRRKIEAKLVAEYGLSAQEASKKVEQAFAGGGTPSKLSQTVGEAHRNARYVKQEASRAVSTTRKVSRKIVRKALLRR